MEGNGNDQKQAQLQPPKKNWWNGASLNVPDNQQEVTKVVESWKNLRSPDYWRTVRQAREQSGGPAQLCAANDDANGKHEERSSLSSGPSIQEFEKLRSQLREEMNSMKVEFEEKISRIKTESDERAAGFTAEINEMATAAVESAAKIRNLEGLLAQARGGGAPKRSGTEIGVVEGQQEGQGGHPIEKHRGEELRSDAAEGHVAPSIILSLASGVGLDAAPKRLSLAEIPKIKRRKILEGNVTPDNAQASSHPVIGGTPKFKCPVESCHSAHSRHTNVIAHVKKCHPELEYKFEACRDCHQLFPTRSELLTHKWSCTAEPTPRTLSNDPPPVDVVANGRDEDSGDGIGEPAE